MIYRLLRGRFITNNRK